MFQDLIRGAEKSEKYHYAVGGNAPVMATRFAIEGASVILAAKRTPYLIENIHPNVQGNSIKEMKIH